MGKLIVTENGQTTVRNFTHLVRVSRYGRLGRPEPFDGTLHLVTGVSQRVLEMHPGVHVEHQSFIDRLIVWVSFFVAGFAVHRFACFM